MVVIRATEAINTTIGIVRQVPGIAAEPLRELAGLVRQQTEAEPEVDHCHVVLHEVPHCQQLLAVGGIHLMHIIKAAQYICSSMNMKNNPL